MTRKEAIISRRAVRRYTGEPIAESIIDNILEFITQVKPLHDDIRTTIEIIDSEDFEAAFSSFIGPRASHYLVIRSAKKEGYLENAGYIGQQIVLYMTELGIGSCWCGSYKQKYEDEAGQLPYVVCVCFGRSDNSPPRRSAEEAKRKHLHELVFGKISTNLLDLLEAGRLAPSALNAQPVRYRTQGSNIYIYRKIALLPFLDSTRGIDVGIAMANMYVASGEECIFVKEANYPTPSSKCIYEYTLTWEQKK